MYEFNLSLGTSDHGSDHVTLFNPFLFSPACPSSGWKATCHETEARGRHCVGMCRPPPTYNRVCTRRRSPTRGVEGVTVENRKSASWQRDDCSERIGKPKAKRVETSSDSSEVSGEWGRDNGSLDRRRTRAGRDILLSISCKGGCCRRATLCIQKWRWISQKQSQRSVRGYRTASSSSSEFFVKVFS